VPPERRIPRERATGYVLELVERICGGGRYLDCITSVHAFGSWSRGAGEVGDVDLVVSYDARLDEEVNRELVDRLVVGRDWNAPFRKALRPRRALQIMFNQLQMVAEPVLVYERGDGFEAAVARVRAIAEDPAAGRAARERVHPVLEPVADALSRPSLIVLSELASRGYIELELIDLPDAELAEISDLDYRRFVHRHWTPTSPLARAARAAGAYLLARGVKLSQVTLLGIPLTPGRRASTSAWAIEAREQHLREFVSDLGRRRVGHWLYVVRPARKRPLRALHVTAANRSALRQINDLDAWLAGNAPHIARIG
jgi:hypothetical protein